MSRLPTIKANQLAAALKRDGWFLVWQSGSHHIFAHPDKPGTLSVPVHQGRDLGTGLLSNLLKDAGLTPDDLRRLL